MTARLLLLFLLVAGCGKPVPPGEPFVCPDGFAKVVCRKGNREFSLCGTYESYFIEGWTCTTK
jgi:hypothetical protein